MDLCVIVIRPPVWGRSEHMGIGGMLGHLVFC